MHTQSPRTSSFGGGANGGMDDRFDWLFVSQSILDETSSMYYVDGTYCAFGNDGNHFNDAINDGTNNSVSAEMADALHDASDHLPVYMDVWFDDLTYSDQGIVITEVMANPASVSDSYGEWFEIFNTTDSTIDMHGWSIKDLDGDEHQLLSDETTIPILPDEYFILAKNGDESQNGGVNVDYVYNGFSLSNSDDEVILLDASGAIVDEVHYSNGWPFSSGVAMELHNPLEDNSLIQNWYASTISYGNGDTGSPGIPFDGTLDIEKVLLNPSNFDLVSLYPNPFNPEVTIQVKVYEEGILNIDVFNLSGQRVKTLINGTFRAGSYSFNWDSSRSPSGMYFFKLTNGKTVVVRKALLLK